MKVATIKTKSARSDQEMASMVKELQRQAKTRKDYVVPVKDINATVVDDMVQFGLNLGDNAPPVLFEGTQRAHETLWNRLDIHKGYYNRMGDEAPDLLAYNINYWTQRSDKNFLARTLDGKVRAFMSDRFRTLDSVECFFTAFQTAKDVGAKIVQADLTETNFDMRILHPEWAERMDGFRMDMKARRTSRDRSGGGGYTILDHLDEGDDGGTYLVPGILLRNSDVGYGSLHAELFIFDQICGNGMIGNRTIHQVHLGAQLDVGLVSQETRELEDRAIWSKVRDMILQSFDRETFLTYLKKIRDSADIQLTDPVESVNLVVKNYSLTEEDQQNILNELMSAGSNTVYGLISAVTAVGRDKGDYDQRLKLERAGGDILNDPTELVRVRRERRTAREIVAQT